MDSKTRLSRADWIQAAFRALTANGPQGIKAEALARDLGVSKGSFYWHFKDVPGLRKAMIKHWQKLATDEVITGLDAEVSPAPDRLRQLMITATEIPRDPYGGRKTEAAIRDWGRYDAAVQIAVNSVDKKRMDYVAGLFQDCGFSGTMAALNARMLYAGLIGWGQLQPSQNDDDNTLLKSLLEILLASPKG